MFNIDPNAYSCSVKYNNITKLYSAVNPFIFPFLILTIALHVRPHMLHRVRSE